jgi:Rieske 2Fe-2S family protein
MSITVRSESPFLSTLPGRYYYDPAIYAQEQERIFSYLWFCVGRVEMLTTVGSYFVVTVGQESVIVVRSADETLHAFLNVCRHRGARLCPEVTGQLKGSIQCHYHAWTYGLDGRLIGAPNVLSSQQFDRRAYGLLPIALEVWEGFIWLSLADNPPAFEPQVREPVIERFGSYEPFSTYQLSKLRVGKSISYDVAANWKIIIENFLECYHCGPMHPELCHLLPGFKSGKSYGDGDAATLAEGVEAFTITGKASRPLLPGLRPEDARRYYGLVCLPNMLLNLLPDHAVVHTLWPEGPTRTRIVCDWLFDATVMSQPGFEPMDAVEIFDIVNRQDWEVCTWTQQSMTSKAFRAGGVYVPAEHHIREFCDSILGMLE